MQNKPEWPNLANVNSAREGALVDEEIRLAMEKGQLINDGNGTQAKYACYELRIGTNVQQLVLDRKPGARNDLYRVKEIPENV